MMFEIYTKPNSITPSIVEWHWLLVKVSSNKPLARNVEPFPTKEECEANIHLIMLTDYSTPVIESTDKNRYLTIGKILNST